MAICPTLETAELDEAGTTVRLAWADGTSARFHAVWLRDNAPEPQTLSPQNGQRLIRIGDIPTDLAVSNIAVEERQLIVIFQPEGLRVQYDSKWLFRNRYDKSHPKSVGWIKPDVNLWDRDVGIADSLSFDLVRQDRMALAEWLGQVRRFGVGRLHDVPTESGKLVQVIDLFGYIRETNYGRWFDVRAEVVPSNLAYTGLGLQAHTDNPYRDPVPTLQLLTCLENSAAGGDSLVVDGFKAVEVLLAEAPDAAALLSGYNAHFAYAGADDVNLTSRRPMIELAPDGELIAVRFNNRSLAPVTDIPFEKMADYYAAYRHLADIIDRPEMAVEFKLTPGDAFIVDNTRVLHARRAYTGTGQRWLQGCYADKDGLLSTLAVLEQSI